MFFVKANSPEEALSWGCEVAERFTENLFQLSNCNDIPSWRASNFAFWIEEDTSGISVVLLQAVPRVELGYFPRFVDGAIISNK